MSGLSSLRRLVTASILVTCVSAGSVLAQAMPAPRPTSGPTSVPATAGPTTGAAPIGSGTAMPPTPTTVAPPSMDIASINGKAINRQAFEEILMRDAGMRVFSIVLDLTLVQGACQGAGITLQGDDFKNLMDSEYEMEMNRLNVPKSDGKPDSKPFTHDQRLNILSFSLQQQGQSVLEYRLTVETHALLRALSKNNVTVEQKDIEDAWELEYGNKRRVHIIVWPEEGPNAVKVGDITAAFKAKRPDGKNVTADDVVALLHLPQPAIWTISENAKNMDKPVEKIHNIAFTELKTAGQVSAETDVPVANDKTQKVLVVLDEIIPSTKDTNTMAKVSDDLKSRILMAKQNDWMNKHLQDLRNSASIDIKDSALGDEFKARDDQNKAIMAAQAASTQTMPAAPTTPATLPAPVPAPK